MYDVEYTAFLKKVEEKLGEKNFKDWYRKKLMAEWWREYDFIRENKPDE
jgi:hypothetical protein